MGFNLDNYEQVKDRIARFYKDHADGRITTELITDSAMLREFAGFKATVWIGAELKATGFAYEERGQDGGVNKNAWVENAETSAIGRALANADYCGTLRPSREEMSKTAPAKQEKIEELEPERAEWESKIKALADGLDGDARAAFVKELEFDTCAKWGRIPVDKMVLWYAQKKQRMEAKMLASTESAV